MKIFLTPTEIFKKYPDLQEKLNWSNSDLGIFMKSKLVIGYYNRNKRVTMIEENSLILLIKFVNTSIEEQLLII